MGAAVQELDAATHAVDQGLVRRVVDQRVQPALLDLGAEFVLDQLEPRLLGIVTAGVGVILEQLEAGHGERGRRRLGRAGSGTKGKDERGECDKRQAQASKRVATNDGGHEISPRHDNGANA